MFRNLVPSVPQKKLNRQIGLILVFPLSFFGFSVPREVFLSLKCSVTILGVKSVPQHEKGLEPLIYIETHLLIEKVRHAKVSVGTFNAIEPVL